MDVMILFFFSEEESNENYTPYVLTLVRKLVPTYLHVRSWRENAIFVVPHINARKERVPLVCSKEKNSTFDARQLSCDISLFDITIS